MGMTKHSEQPFRIKINQPIQVHMEMVINWCVCKKQS